MFYYRRDAQNGDACCLLVLDLGVALCYPVWHLEFWDGSWMFGKFLYTLHYRIYSILLLVSIPTHLICIRFILILSFHIHLCLPNAFFPSRFINKNFFVKFASLTYVLSVTVLFVCVISYWCSLKTISYATKLLITHLSLSSCYFLFLSNIASSTLLSDTFIFQRKCSFHGNCMLWRRIDRWAASLWNPYSTFHPRLTLPYDYWPGHCLWNLRHEFHIHMADRPGDFTTLSLCTLNINP